MKVLPGYTYCLQMQPVCYLNPANGYGLGLILRLNNKYFYLIMTRQKEEKKRQSE